MLLSFPFKNAYFEEIEKAINDFFEELILQPMQKEVDNFFSASELKTNNNETYLAQAFQSNRIIYQDGVVIGNFNSKISRALRELGARYSSSKKGWLINKNQLPASSVIAITNAADKFNKLTDRLIQTIDSVKVDEAIKNFNTIKEYENTLSVMDTDFRKKAKSITIEAVLTEATKNVIAKEYSQNLNLYIKKFTDESILNLRKKVQTNVFSGKRAENLIKIIMDENQVTKSKAKFLAKQETSLLTSKFREERFKSLGVTTYIWRGALDARERQDHRELEGKIFSWDNPPVVNKATGKRAHPGEDFGCRCIAVARV